MKQERIEIAILNDEVLLIVHGTNETINQRLTPEEAKSVGYALIFTAAKVVIEQKSDSTAK